VCIAGAKSTGHRAVSSVFVSRSSAKAVGGLREQVGGGRRDDDELGRAAEAHVRHLVGAGPDVGGDGLPGQGRPVASPTNVSAAAVGTTRTR
jgi:hypothetical protein